MPRLPTRAPLALLGAQRRRWAGLLYGVSLPLLALAPPAVSNPLGDVLRFVSAPRGQSYRRQVVRALGVDMRRAARIVTQARRIQIRADVDLARWLRHPERYRDLVQARDAHHLHAAHAAGRGVVLVSVHTVAHSLFIVPWLSPDGLAKQHGYRIHAVISTEHLLYPHTPASLAYSPDADVKRLARGLTDELAGGGIVFIMVDVLARGGERHTVCHPYFGVPKRYPVGAAMLARLAQAPIVPCVLLRSPRGTTRLHFLPALPPPPRNDRAADAVSTRVLLDTFERVLRARPVQYLEYPWARATDEEGAC